MGGSNGMDIGGIERESADLRGVETRKSTYGLDNLDFVHGRGKILPVYHAHVASLQQSSLIFRMRYWLVIRQIYESLHIFSIQNIEKQEGITVVYLED